MTKIQLGDGPARGGHGIGRKRALRTRIILAALLTPAPLGPICLAMPAVAQVRAETLTFDIPSQPINEALLSFARQAGVRFVMPDAQFGNVRSNAVRGAFDRESALAELLRGTGVAARLENGAIVLQRSAAASGPSQLASRDAVEAAQAVDHDADRVIVVGTNIRGVEPSSSPIEVYAAREIARTGATTTEQFIQKLPQNFGTRTQYANNSDPTNDSTRNRDAVASVDLRGLGAGTTLTLLNGRRLGSSDFGRSVDVSLIPIAAIERVEVLTDGASAIYGSDAIGGVVNFVLRDDFDGAETRLSYGGVTDGALRQGDVTQTLGGKWDSGHGLASYNYHSASALERFDRDYAAAAGAGTLTPYDVRHNLLLTGSQDLSQSLTLNGDLAFARRKVKNEATSLLCSAFGFPSCDTSGTYRSETDQVFGNLGLSYRVTETLNASLQASYSQTQVESESSTLFFNLVPPFRSRFPRENDHSTLDITGMVDGDLFQLPGGTARFSVGGGFLDETYQGTTTLNGEPSNRDLSRRTSYAFAEVFAPLVGEEQDIPFVRRLELSLAGRYTSYEDTSSPPLAQDFGSATDPKVGITWAPLDSLALRASYGTSFRAPSLTEIDPTGGQNQHEQAIVDGAPAWLVNFVAFPASQMQPETAITFSAGFDYRPAGTGLRFSGTYYNISYEDRIGQAPDAFASDLLTNPAAHPDVIFRPPSAAFIQQSFGLSPFSSEVGPACPGVDLADRAAVAACIFAKPNLYAVDRRIRNLALSEQDGFDLSAITTFDTQWGEVSTGANLTRILSYRQQLSRTSPMETQVDNDFGKPSDLRARAFLTLSRGGLSGTFNLNYVDDYRMKTPATGIDSSVTSDLNLSYDFGDASGFLDGVQLSLSAQNLFDEDPPFVPLDPTLTFRDAIGFDAANANPLGRLVVVGLTKRW